MKKKLTAERIAKLRKKIRRYRLFSRMIGGEFDRHGEYVTVYGLDYIDAIRRFLRKTNRRNDWDQPDLRMNIVLRRHDANYALVPEGCSSDEDVVWFYGFRSDWD